ncbi:kinesin-like protein KIF27 [Rhodnius prolixus]|uniref:kinesin-like protein KIF27 n=1 Tax=Rhodnius prolixus TaxID=13249 RepID=UPI003D18B423
MVSSIQGAVRVRPPFQTNQIVEDVCVSAIPQTRQIVVGSIACFTVDYAFPSDTSQSNLYETCLSDLVNHFLQGWTYWTQLDLSAMLYVTINR